MQNSSAAILLATGAAILVSVYFLFGRRSEESEQKGSVAGHDGDRVAFTLFTPSERQSVSSIPHGIVLLCDAGGVDEEPTRRFARRLADEEGLVVMLPDLFRGSPWSDTRDRSIYEAWRATHPAERVDGDTAAAIAYLSKRCQTVSIVGLCFGGGVGWRASVAAGENASLCAAALCYPTRIDVAASASRGGIAVPTLCLFGDQDPLTSTSYINEVRLAMERSAAPARLRVMTGVGHGFVHKPSTALERTAAEEAFATLMRFLRWSHKFAKAESSSDMRDSVDEDTVVNQGMFASPTPKRASDDQLKTKTPQSNRLRTTSAGYDDLGGKEDEDLLNDIDASLAPYSPDDDDDDVETERR